MSWFMEKLPSKKGMTHSYVNYKSSHTSHRYEAKTEEIVQFPGMPMITDYEHSSPRKDFSSKPLRPWGLIHDQPEKAEGFSPKFHGKDTGSPRKDFFKANSPTARDHERGKYNSFHKDDDSDDDDEYDYVCNEDGVCVRNKKPGFKPNHLIDEGNVRNSDKYRANDYETNYEHTKPRKQTYYDKSYDDLDLEKEKGQFFSPKHTTHNYNFPSSNHPSETYYEKSPSYYTEKDQGKSKPYGYTVPPSNQPKREPYYGRSYSDRTTEKEKETSHAAYSHPNQPKRDGYYDKAPTYYNDKRTDNSYNPSYTVPSTIIPRKEQQYDTSNNRQMMMVANPPPIRTRVDRGRDADYYNDNGKNNSPHYNSPSRKDHQGYGDPFEDVEARRRYGKAGPRIESYVEEVIDAREAARRYKGILLTT